MTTSQNALEDVSLLCTVEDSVSEAKKDKQTNKKHNLTIHFRHTYRNSSRDTYVSFSTRHYLEAIIVTTWAVST